MRTILVHIQPTYIFRGSIDSNRKILKGSTRLVFLLMSLLEMKVKLNQGKISNNNQILGFILYLLLICMIIQKVIVISFAMRGSYENWKALKSSEPYIRQSIQEWTK